MLSQLTSLSSDDVLTLIDICFKGAVFQQNNVINNIHIPEFFFQAFARLCGVRLQGERITKNGDRYVK